MAIHHATQKKAAKIGVTLEPHDDLVRAFWPERGVEIFGASTDEAMKNMQAAQALYNKGYRVKPFQKGSRLCEVFGTDDGSVYDGKYATPFEIFGRVNKGEPPLEPLDPEDQAAEIGDDATIYDGETIESQKPVPNVKRADNGIALDGGVAYREGTAAGDNPFNTETEDEEEYQRAVKWDEEWDAAADEASEQEEGKGGSVVSPKYRAIYAERGHPNHCGDWLAEILNNLCLTKKDTDIARFTAICEANGVDMGKYDQSNPGWQGRYRMTGRNLLAKRVYFAGGVLKTPVEGAEAEYRAPKDWMETQRFKMPKAEQSKPIPEAE